MEIQENKAVEPTLKDSTDYLVALMVLKQVEAENELDPLLRTLKSKLDKSGTGASPYHLLNTMFSQEAIVESKTAYAEIWEAIYKEIEAANIKPTLPHAGYSQEEIDTIPEEVIQHFSAVSVFEDKFPDEGAQKFPLSARLKEGKEMLFDALNSSAGKTALSAASWGISLATGGIVTRLAVKGGAALAMRLIQNESVQSFASKVQGRVTNFLQRAGVPTGTLAGHFRDFKENAKSVMASETFQRYGKPSLALAGVALGAIMLGNLNHDKLIEVASSGLSKGADLASAGVDATVSGLGAAKDMAGHALSAVSDGVVHGVSVGETMLADGIHSFYTDPMGTLKAIANGGVNAVGSAASFVADTAHEAGTVVADAAKSGYEAVAVGAGHAADASRDFVADALHKGGDLVAGVDHTTVMAPSADYVGASPDDVLEGRKMPTDAPRLDETSAPSGVPVGTYEIQKGDSLWKISKEHFIANGIEPTNSQIHEATVKLYEANKDLIGANPDRIFTGHDLKVDPALFAAKVDHASDLKAVSDMLGTKPGFPIEAAPVIPDAAPASSLSDVGMKTELDKLNQLLTASPASPADGAISFSEAAKRVAGRDVGSESSLGM